MYLTQADPKWIDNFDDMIVNLLKAFGITNSAIIGLVILSFGIKSWMDGIYGSLKIAANTYHNVSTATRQLRGRGTVVAIVVSILTLGSTAIAVSMAYIAGNFFSLAIDEISQSGSGAGRLRVFETAWADSGVPGLYRLTSSPALVLDVPTTIVILLALFAFYRAFRGGVFSSWFGWGFVAALPVSLWLAMALPFGVLALLVNLAGPGIDMTDQNTRAAVIGLGLTGLYCTGLTVAVRGAQIAGSAWTARSKNSTLC